MSYKTIENFLTTEEHTKINNLLSGPEFRWFYQEVMTIKDNCFLSHVFYDNNNVNSPLYPIIIVPFLNKLKAHAVHSVRANLTISFGDQYQSEWHTDTSKENCKTAIYYVNNNNGYTELKNNIKIDSKANRMLIFNSQIQHRMFSATDIKNRLVINFNYYD
tara:strand:+ start:68 stop:550 length:483 start_codon:yes stop_codon:yes gene_type:complete